MRTTLIVTTYNRPDALKQVIAGLQLQTRPPDEVVVADDGSDERTRSLIDRIAPACPFPLRHIWQPDRGYRLAEIRNKALCACQGDFILMLDGDCIPERRFVADHIDLAEAGCFFQGKRVLLGPRTSHAVEAVGPGHIGIRHLLSPDIGNRHHLLRLPFFPPLKTRKLSGVRGCNMAYYRTDILAVNGYNQDFTGWGREDSELVARFYRFGLTRKEHPFRAICYHLWHPENDRSRLDVNDGLLKAALASESHVCRNGIQNLDEAPSAAR